MNYNLRIFVRLVLQDFYWQALRRVDEIYASFAPCPG